MEIQSVPNPDSPNNEAFEAIVELYYQTHGYITSSGKWFWVWEQNKKQRGYQDIDVLALNGRETLIVSVTSNLDDKLRQGRDGEIKQKMLNKLNSYFNRVIEYLSTVPQYQWLVEERDVKRVVAYNHVFKNAHKKVIPTLNANGITTISAKDILRSLSKYIQQPNLKIQDQMLRTIQLINWNGRIEI